MINTSKRRLYGLDVPESPFFYHPSTDLSDPQCLTTCAEWARKPLWELEEAVALSFGKDPFVVHWLDIPDGINVARQYYPLGLCKASRSHPFVRDYRERRNLFWNAFDAGRLIYEYWSSKLLAIDLIKWAKRVDIEFPAELVRLVTKYYEGELYGDQYQHHEAVAAPMHSVKPTPQPIARNGRGRPAVKPGVEVTMRKDLETNKLSLAELRSMTGAQLEERYNHSRNTVAEVRDKLLSEIGNQSPRCMK